MTPSRLFIVGIEGKSLAAAEREIFRRQPPGGVILFARNIGTERELYQLVGEIRASVAGILLFVDQEGGPVDRFRAVAGPSLSFSEAARLGRAREAGRLAGELCAFFAVDVDLAPVVDRAVEGAGREMLRNRCASEDPVEIVEAAAEFLAGLAEFGTGSCLKHFPGLGRGTVDSHLLLPRLVEDPEEAGKDLEPFVKLKGAADAVMIAHAAFGNSPLPATLDRAIADDLLRGEVGFEGVAIGDDLEMGALSACGDLPGRAVAAVEAGCDLLILGRETEALHPCVERLAREVPEPRLAQASIRRQDFFDTLLRRRAAADRPRALAEIARDIAALNEMASRR